MTFHILVLDDCLGPSVNKLVSYTDFVSKNEDQVEILVITTTNGLSEKDKQNCLAYKELDNPVGNGLVEVWALRFHEQYRIDMVYTKQEDLILRAAYLRETLGLTNGLSPEQALNYRDKERMKRKLQEAGFPVPHFQRIFSPVNILGFIKANGFPVIVKPTLGQASSGIRVLKNNEDCEKYLSEEFYDRLNDKIMDYSGDMMVESYMAGKMYHVNGYAKNGKIHIVWPFKYYSTNLDFTTGKSYGNIFISKKEPIYTPLIESVQKILDVLTTSEHMLFHAELFETTNEDGSIGFALCEIAARRPGGSIGLLIDEVEGLFAEIEFRLNNGLPLRHDRSEVEKSISNGFSVADLMIPRQIGKLVSIPSAESCPLAYAKYTPLAKIGDKYRGFNVNVLNTAARFLLKSVSEEHVSISDCEKRLLNTEVWFNRQVSWENEDGLESLFDKVSLKK